jgi:diguanylate cyclase (GGDEF)-like protein
VSARIERGQAPAAGFEESKHDSNSAGDFISSIAAARQEAQTVFELSQDLVNSLSLNETLSMFVARLIRLVPFDAATIYVRKGDRLIPEFVNGDDFRLFSSLEIPMGVGISGWVAENRKAILNGNPAVECMYTKEPGRTTTLHSALAVPLEGVDRVVGVLALYRREADAFSKDHLRVLLALASKLGLSIENALRYREAQSSATTDYLTKLPNARSLFVHLDSELARAQRRNESVAVLVCDLDGFKQVNDRFGHLEGNRVLQAVAAGLQRCCREYDYVARMGGDEFVLVLPGIAAAHLSSKVQELEQIVETAGRTVCPDASIGASIGAGFFPEDGCDAEALLATADRRMYKTKQSHKSRQRPLELLQYQPVSSTIQ